MAMLRQRIIDLAEIDRLIKPHTGIARIRQIHPDNRAEVEATILARGATADEVRLSAVANGNAAIAAIEAAGYEHAYAPKITLDGIETMRLDSEACDYLVHAELSMDLLGKRSPR